MLTRTGRTMLAAGLAFAAGGIVFGNWPFFGAGALLLLYLAFGGLARTPHVERQISSTHIERGGHVTLDIHVRLPRGLGVVEVHQALPEEFELVEGNNFHVLTLGLQPKTKELRLRARAPKRGEWILPPVDVRVVHASGLATTTPVKVGEPVTLFVEPRPIAARLPRDLRTRALRPFPDGDMARMGVATNDFRELREYVPGDPPRRINWKATARRIGSGASTVPLVNETEWEGKKSVYILVDGHARLSVGTNIDDARERAADAALSLMELYLRRGYQVGLALARSGDVPSLRPGTGQAQVRRARELLSRLCAAEGPSLMDVLQRDTVHLHKAKPLIVLVTRLAGEDADLKEAIRRIGALGHHHGRNLVPGLIIDLEPEQSVTEDIPVQIAQSALQEEAFAHRAAARHVGVRVTSWRLGREPLESVLARGRIA